MARKTKTEKNAPVECRELVGARLDDDLKPVGKVMWQVFSDDVLINGTRWGWNSLGGWQIFTEHISMNHSRSWLTVYSLAEPQKAIGRIQAPEKNLREFAQVLAYKEANYHEAMEKLNEQV